ncbi:MAG: epimerase, partial [Thermoplasmata archaeon]
GSVTGRKARVDEISDVTDDTYRLVADISKLESLGFTPAISLEDGVKELSEEFGEEPELPSVATVFKEGQRAERQAVR